MFCYLPSRSLWPLCPKGCDQPCVPAVVESVVRTLAVPASQVDQDFVGQMKAVHGDVHRVIN